MSTTYGRPYKVAKLSDLAKDMYGRLPGCPPVLILKTLNDVARDFSQQTGAFRTKVGPFDFTEDTALYSITIPYMASISVLHAVYKGDSIIEPSSYTFYPDADGGPQVKFAFAPSYTSELAWSADVSLLPDIGCDEYPAEFLQRWGHGIMSGALFEIMADDTKKWGSASGVAIYGKRYHEAKQNAGFLRLSASSRDGRLSFMNDDSFAGNSF